MKEEKGTHHVTHSTTGSCLFLPSKKEITMKRAMTYMVVALGIFLPGTLKPVLAGTTINPKYGNSAGETGAVGIAQLQPGWVVAAMCSSSGQMKLTSLHDSGSGLVRVNNNTTDLYCNSDNTGVAITAFNSTTVVTVNAEPSLFGYFQVAAWAVNTKTGAITQWGSTAVGGGYGTYGAEVESISIANVPDTTMVAVASIGGSPSNAGDQQLMVSAYFIPSTATGDITSGGADWAYGPYNTTSIASPTCGQILTASVLSDSNDLDIDAWSVNSGGLVTKEGNLVAGSASGPQIATLNPSTVVTAFTNGSNDNEIVSWTVSSTGVLARQATGTASGSGPALCALYDSYLGATIPFTAVEKSAGLAAQAWTMTSLSSIGVIASYNTTWANAPVACAPINTNLVVTVAYINGESNLAFEEWYVNSN
jgi:hypothetical protein